MSSTFTEVKKRESIIGKSRQIAVAPGLPHLSKNLLYQRKKFKKNKKGKKEGKKKKKNGYNAIKFTKSNLLWVPNVPQPLNIPFSFPILQ